MEFKKYFHFDTDIEKAVIGVILLKLGALDSVIDILTPEMFYSPSLERVYGHLLEMRKKGFGIDLLTAVNYIVNQDSNYELYGNDIRYILTNCTQEVTNGAHLLQYAGIIKSLYISREWMKIKNIARDDYEGMEEAADKIQKLRSRGGKMEFIHIDEAIISLYRHMAEVEDQKQTGVPTGCRRLDTINGGYSKGQFIVIGARPSVGKSAFMAKAVLDAAEKGYHVGIISLEMPKEQVAGRLAAIVSKLDFWRIYRAKLGADQEREKNHKKIMSLSGRSIYIADKVKVNMMDIRAAAIRMRQSGRLDILYIDYLQLVDSSGQTNKNYNREQEVATLSRGLKVLALELGIPIIALSQLNREMEKQGAAARYPKLSDLRESGSLEQDADAVLFIHRDYQAGKTVDEEGRSTERVADILVGKWRNGETTNGTGPIKMGWDPAKMQFIDVEKWEDYLAYGHTGAEELPPPPQLKKPPPAPPPAQGARLFIDDGLPTQKSRLRRIDLATGEVLDNEDPF